MNEPTTRHAPAKLLLTALAIVVGLIVAINYFVRVSNAGWQESKGYIRYSMEAHRIVTALGWIAGATVLIWVALAWAHERKA